jgi:predicted nucleic acid-binding protein
MVTTYLLDTSVYSQPLKVRPLKSVMDRWQSIGDRSLHVSIFCETEVLLGLELKSSERLWAAYAAILKNRLPITGFDLESAAVFARVQANSKKTGQTRPTFDLLIASTAIAHGHILATCNFRDFRDIPGLRAENWGVR